jgi:hypothetical protein
MKRLALMTVSVALLAFPAAAQTTPETAPNNPTPRDSGARDVHPGSVGPGSEKNSEVSPTSPSIPTHAQPPPEIPAPSGASGSNPGTSGSAGTTDSAPSKDSPAQ